MNIKLPYNFEPREYQKQFLRIFDNQVNHNGKIRKFVKVWHRRAGKEKIDVNICAKQMQMVKGAYYYFFPTYTQGNKILWEGMDKSGFKFLDHFPKELLDGKPNNTNMSLKFKNGSLFQVIGTDNINSVVGTNPRGCVFSEYSLQDPKAWDFIRPILAENDGWALFNFTPRGENHGKDLFDYAESDPLNWHCELLTVEDTKAIPKEVLDQERKEIIQKNGNDALYQQEYMCSFTAPISGAYYASNIMEAYKQGRITTVPYDVTVPVDTYWDLGIDDSMTIIFTQIIGKEIRVMDYVEGSGEGLPYYIKILQDKGYIYGEHYAPHDINVRELTNGISRLETAAKLGLRFQVAPSLSIEDGIHAVRMLFGNMWIDKDKCKRLINSLKSYEKEFDDKNRIYKNHPLHNWASHGADALRILSVSFNQKKMTQTKRVNPFTANLVQPDRNTLAYEAMRNKNTNKSFS